MSKTTPKTKREVVFFTIEKSVVASDLKEAMEKLKPSTSSKTTK